MTLATYSPRTEYERAENHNEIARLLKQALPSLIAWANPWGNTDTYRARGADTLTIGDQARWIQVKGLIATAPVVPQADAQELPSQITEPLSEYEKIVHLLTERKPASPSPRTMFIAPTTAHDALRKGDNTAARALIAEWLDDESGYDEQVWSDVQTALEQNRL